MEPPANSIEALGVPAIGDRQALELAIESFRSYLLFVAWRIKGERLAGKEGASDLVQRTIVAAVERIREGNVPGSTDELRKAWLRKLLYKTFRKMVRHENTQRRGGGLVRGGLEEPVPDPATSPSGKAMRNEQEHLLAEAFAQLDPDEQQLVTWRYIEGVTCEEIGRRRGCSGSYVSRICHEVIGRLRQAMKE